MQPAQDYLYRFFYVYRCSPRASYNPAVYNGIKIFTEVGRDASKDFKFHYGDIQIEDGCFTEVTECGGEVPENCVFILPGMVDIHIHGNSGFDFSDGNYDELKTIARYLALAGTTSFSATSMTVPEKMLTKAYKNAVRLRLPDTPMLSLLLAILPQIAGNMSFAIIVLMGFIWSVPIELEEAAYLDGYGRCNLRLIYGI